MEEIPRPAYKEVLSKVSEYEIKKENGRSRPAHDLLMEQLLGRPLKPSEVVHHIDGNKRNNSPENLQLLERAEHSRLHASGRPQSPETLRRQRESHEGKANAARRSLSPEQVRQIAEALHNGASIRAAASEFGVKPCVVRSIRDGKTYKDVLASLPAGWFPLPKRSNGLEGSSGAGSRRFSPGEVTQLRLMLLQGQPLQKIAEAFHTNVGTIRRIRDGETYRDVPWPEKLAELRLITDARRLADLFLSEPFPTEAEEDRSALTTAYGLYPTRPALLLFRLLKRAIAGSAEDALLFYAISSHNAEVDRILQEESQLSLIMQSF